MNINIGRAVSAGAIGTAMMTAVGLWMAPLMGLPPMNPAVMLAGATGGSLALGSLVGHLVYGGVVGGVFGEVTEAKTAPAAA